MIPAWVQAGQPQGAPKVTAGGQAGGAKLEGAKGEGAKGGDGEAAAAKQAALEEAFTKKMSGCVFNGSYSVTTGAEEKSAVMEKYTIEKVSKAQGDLWLFNARWLIAGLGTFSSRVLIHEEWYAGTWRHDKVGGHLWGRIERAKAGPEKGLEKGDTDKGGQGKPGENK
jgi:hypothetical protein